MAKFTFNFDTELTKQLERMADYENIAPKLLKGAVPILKKRVIEETDKYHEYSQDKELVSSIKETAPKENKNGWFISVRPVGTDSDGVRNMEKMAHLEFGYNSKLGKHISAKPILTKALNEARDEVTEKMQELFNEVVNE